MSHITLATINLIKQFEGKRLKAYQDSVGIWTIGYGHIKGVYQGMEITEQTAKKLLIDDLAIAHACVMRVIKKPMNNNESGAFISLIHNIGVGAFAGSTAARKFNKGDKEGAAKAILMWNKITIDGIKVVSQGLINRREAEVVYFEMGVSDAAFPTHFYETTAGVGGLHKEIANIYNAVVLAVVGLSGAIALWWGEIQVWFGSLGL